PRHRVQTGGRSHLDPAIHRAQLLDRWQSRVPADHRSRAPQPYESVPRVRFRAGAQLARAAVGEAGNPGAQRRSHRGGLFDKLAGLAAAAVGRIKPDWARLRYAPINAHVFGPTMPSGTTFLLRWNARTAASVPGPKMPSAVRASFACTALTGSPRLPRFKVGLPVGSAG